MRILLIACFIMQSFTLAAQDKAALAGTWKIVVMRDEEMYFDLKKDSLYMKEFDELTPEQLKLANTMILEQTATLRAGLAASYFSFLADGNFSAKMMTDTLRSGKFTMNETSKTITLHTKKEGDKLINETEELKYEFRKNRLILYGFAGDDGMKAEFEKQQ